jgi:dipeptidyl aminopeptidase/acylaminoacyl peptidase
MPNFSLRPVTGLAALSFALFVAPAAGAQAAKRALTIDDIQRIADVRDPQCSPDGAFIAYVRSITDVKEDKSSAHIWMIGFDGRNDRQITFGAENTGSPRWSPDNRYLSFTSSRPGAARGSQVWLLDRAGGEAFQLTNVKGRLQGYEWSPDGKRLALVVGDPDPETPAGDTARGTAARAPKPIVIDRYRFKQDGQGYLRSGRNSYIYLFDVATKSLERLTKGVRDESNPSWSPDGTRIAFTSNRHPDPDRNPSSQVFVVDAKPGSTEMALTPPESRGGGRLEWSPDGKWIAFTESDELKYASYGMAHLTLISTDGKGKPMRVQATEALDRGVSGPQFSADGKWITVFVTDDRSVYPVRVSATGGGSAEKLVNPPVTMSNWTTAGACSAVLSSTVSRPTEIYRATSWKLEQLTRHNDWLANEVNLGNTEGVTFKGKDGTPVSGLLTTPVGYVAGSKVPLLLRIHGGPNAQDAYSFSSERHFFANHGYAVLNVNYRGSSGRGQKFSRAIWADWGNHEVTDLQAGVDHVVKMGVADPDKLGVGGWSYGGILTDYLIASDTRFKAGTSGAGTAFTVAFYGTDQYITQYDHEIGPPWDPKAWETYQKLSYPFLHANRIKTPTLFLGGANDFNVPIAGSEQMYQALRTLGVETQLVIYPNENHGITRPSYQRDRLERYLAWYDRFLKTTATAAQAGDKR